MPLLGTGLDGLRARWQDLVRGRPWVDDISDLPVFLVEVMLICLEHHQLIFNSLLSLFWLYLLLLMFNLNI